MCMCDRDDNYLCFYCEDYIKGVVKNLIHTHKNDILETGDWWYAVGTANDIYDVNVHCPDDENFETPEAVFNINLYRLDRGDEPDVQYDLEPMTRREIRIL